jgi:hypothetical protein
MNTWKVCSERSWFVWPPLSIQTEEKPVDSFGRIAGYPAEVPNRYLHSKILQPYWCTNLLCKSRKTFWFFRVTFKEWILVMYSVILQRPVALHRSEFAFAFMSSMWRFLNHNCLYIWRWPVRSKHVASLKKKDDRILTDVAHRLHKSKTQIQIMYRIWTLLFNYEM